MLTRSVPAFEHDSPRPERLDLQPPVALAEPRAAVGDGPQSGPPEAQPQAPRAGRLELEALGPRAHDPPGPGHGRRRVAQLPDPPAAAAEGGAKEGGARAQQRGLLAGA